MRTPERFFAVLSLWFAVACVSSYAQINLYSDTFGAGATATDGNSLVSGTVGQTLIGRVVSGNDIVGEGFWYTLPVPNIADVPGNPAVAGTAVVLHQNTPNPFSGTTTIAFDLASSGHVSLKLFDAMGKEVRTLIDGGRQAGRTTVTLNAEQLESGYYLARLTANGVSRTIAMTVIR